MPFKKKEKPKAEIDVGSMSDISFLLIIFFILTTSLSRPTGREIAIPAAQPPEQQKQTQTEDKTPVVNVLPDRLMMGQGANSEATEPVTFPQLRTALEKLNLRNAAEKDRFVVVEVADEVDYDRYYKVVTMIAEAGGIIALVEKE